MTQIATFRQPAINAGPRGIGGRNSGGAYSQDGQQDLIDSDAFQSGPIELSGTTDAINGSVSGNYLIKTAGVDAVTLTAPRAGLDDNLSIAIYSDTTNAHTVTLPSALYASGVALKTIATFAAFRGAGLALRAYNGSWQVISQSAITFT
jgi:hypothetical protein